jgi:hypothetical protein
LSRVRVYYVYLEYYLYSINYNGIYSESGVITLKNIKNINIFLKTFVLSLILILSVTLNLTAANPTVSNIQEAVNYIIDKLSIKKDEVLIYVLGPVYKGEKIFSTKEHILDVPEKGYVIYIDLYPVANLFHPVRYIFLSENTNDFIIKDSNSPPKNFDDYIMIETNIGNLFKSIQNRRAPIPENAISNSMRSLSDSRYAVLMSGGYDSGNNHVRYWNDLSNIYMTLNYVYGYLDENIIVLCSDGLNPAPDQSNGQNSDPDLDGDGDNDIMYSCVLSNVDLVFSDLANNLTNGNELFVFSTDHGDTNGGWNTVFNLWNYEELTDSHFATLLEALPEIEIICTFEPCFSGGFLDNVVVPPGPVVASSACRYDEYSYAMSDLIYDEFAFYWTAAVTGADAYGNPVDADYNQDGIVAMDEAFIYAESHDNQPENPQYDDYPENIGTMLSLWPGSTPPETPSAPDGPKERIQYEEATFSSSTTEPDGESIYYMFDWGNGNKSEWVGPYASGQPGEASYSWLELGEYEIKVVAKDINGVQSNWSAPSNITIVENDKPEKPIIKGPKISIIGKKMDFTIVATDPNNHDLYYFIYWGDQTFDFWIGPFASGEKATFNHTFNKSGSFIITARARDVLSGESPQAQYKINILKNRAAGNPFILRTLEHFKNILVNKFHILIMLLQI